MSIPRTEATAARPVPTAALKLSIVLPAYNEREHIGVALEALQAQRVDPQALEAEVIVVDDGSTDGTGEVASAAPAPLLDVRVLRLEPNQGRIRARRAGVEAARHEMVFLTDARVRAYPDLLAELVRLAALGREPVQGLAVGSPELGGVDRVFYLVRRRIYDIPTRETLVSEANFEKAPKGFGMFLVRRDRYLRHAAARDVPFANDDTGIARQIVRETGIWVEPTVLVRHRENRGLRRVLRRMYYRGAVYADYYLAPGGSHRRRLGAALVIAALACLGAALVPGALPWVLGVAALAAAAASAILARRPADVLLILGWGALLVPTFLAGALRLRITRRLFGGDPRP